VNARALLFLSGCLPLLAGCKLLPHSFERATATPYRPTNVYVRQPALPENLRRVAVLPVPKNRQDPNHVAGVEMLEPVFRAEFARNQSFEVISVSPEDVKTLNSGKDIKPEEPIDPEFLDRLMKATACDGVLFVGLTDFRAYPPLRVGWKTRLIDCRERMTWWSVDEVIDAGMDSVVAGAQAYGRNGLNAPNPLLDDGGVLQSPRRFGQYASSLVVRTLPGR
jgi:hypothetical protein